MVTKNTKLPGKNYWDNAAKQFVWPIDHKEKHILVPQQELEQAEDHLMVMHFRANGWHIQSVIGEVDKKKVFTTEGLKSDKPIFKPIKKEAEQIESVFKPGDRFKITSTECELRISFIERGKIHLEYTNRDKHNIITSEENLNRSLSMQTWVRI